jgi:tetratricopeptide (TPR) repeat protein
LYSLWAWAINNRQKLIVVAAAVAVAVGAVAYYKWRQDAGETEAAEALSKLRPQPATTPGGSPVPVSAEAYLAVVNAHPKSAAASRALLLGAGASFAEGKYEESKKQFERFLREFPDSPYRGEALFGVAASLEAQGKTAETVSAYREFVDRRANDPNATRAKLGLARLTVKENPSQAYRLYEEVARAEGQTAVGYQAEIALEELRRTHPNLTAPATNAAPIFSAPTTTTIPAGTGTN